MLHPRRPVRPRLGRRAALLNWIPVFGRWESPTIWPSRVSEGRAIAASCVGLFLLFAASVGMAQGSLRADAEQSWIRQLYPDYDAKSGLVPSEHSKIVNVLSAQAAVLGGTPVLLIRVALGPDGPLDCPDCGRLVDFALLDPESKPVAFQKGILGIDGRAQLSILPDDFFQGPHNWVLGVRVRENRQGIDSEVLHLIDIRPPPQMVLDLQTYFSTCGAPGADETAGITQTGISFHAEGPYPITLNRTRRDCRGRVIDQSMVPLVWDGGARHFHPPAPRP